MKLKRIEAALFIGVAAALLFGFSADAEARDISTKVVRLHVVANSDSEADQSLKLLVRDAVLDSVSLMTNGCENSADAETIISENLSKILDTAQKTVENQGFSYNVSVSMGDEYYETRQYETFSLPAGTYRSLIIKLGEGEGHNWWCVVFPQICMAASSEELTAEAMAAGLAGDEIAFITGEKEIYVLKFKAVEIFQSIMRRFSQI